MTDRITLTEVLDFLQSANRVEVEAASTTLAARHRQLKVREAQELRSKINPGDKVVVTGGIKPKYFIGRQGTVIEMTGDRVLVDFGAPMRRYGSKVRIPINCLAVAK